MFFFPIVLVAVIYIRVLLFMYHHLSQFTKGKARRRAQRDVMVTRRIIFIILMMTLPGLPNIVFVIVTNINPNLSGSYYMYRIQWMGPVIAILILSIVLVQITPQLKVLITSFSTKQRTHKRIVALEIHERGEPV